MGATPETLLEVNAMGIHTMALAGTQGVNNQPIDQVKWGQKELQEQALVSEYIESLLDRFNISDFQKSGPSTYRAGNVYHLKTQYDIHQKLTSKKQRELIRELHPTPAVCGLPKGDALSLIHSIEPHDREYYAGYLGPVEGEDTLSLFVNLRSMKLLDNSIALYIGGGITPDSDPRKEWEETCLKAQTLLQVAKVVTSKS